MTVTVCAHVFGGLLGRVKKTFQVRANNRVQVVFGVITDRLGYKNSRIVDEDVNAGVNSGQRTEQNQATCGARMRPPGGRSPSGGLMRARRF